MSAAAQSWDIAGCFKTIWDKNPANMNAPTIVDSHCHFWDPARFHYAWNHGFPALDRAFLPRDFSMASAKADVRKIIFVECDCGPSQNFAEIDWVSDFANNEPRLKGAVVYAPVEKGEAIRADLGMLAARPLVKGVRRNLQGEREIQFGLRPEFIAGVKVLAEFGFTFDLCIRHEQLRSVAELAKRVPQVTFVLDHFGKPDVRGSKIEPWAKDLKTLAVLPNVVCKISGLTTEADWGNWQSRELKFYFEHALECFGFNRLMFGSDWPMATLATTYERWIETVQELFSFAPEADQIKLFQTNAEKIYRV
jgi:L-fuconolactonase